MSTANDQLQRLYPFGVLCLVVVVVTALYWSTIRRMMEMWSLGTYQHGWLVLPLALFLLWRERDALSRETMTGSWLGVFVAACVALTWQIGRVAHVQSVEFFAVVSLIPATYWALCGTKIMRMAIAPLALLFFAIPTGQFLVGDLMEVTANISMALLHFFGVPTFREGMFITLPGGSFEVARVCAGLRYLLAGAMASFAFAYLSYQSWFRRACFVLSAVIVLILANGLRAFIVMYVASATEMKVLAGEDHVTFGMFLFGGVFLLLVLVGSRFADKVQAGEAQTEIPVRVNASPTIWVAMLLIMGFAPLTSSFSRLEPLSPGVLQGLPAFDDCEGPGEWQADWRPRYPGADRVELASYDCPGYRLDIWLADYVIQEQGKELVSSDNRVWPKTWRRFTSERRRRLESALGILDVNEVIVDQKDSKRVIWYWYQVGSTVTGSVVEVKFRESLEGLLFRNPQSSVFVLSVSSEEPTELSIARLEKHTKSVIQHRLVGVTG